MPAARPLLLLLDRHSSQYYPETIHKAANEQIIIFVLPLNTTHFIQPLRKCCFGLLKAELNEVRHKYIINNPGKVINWNVSSCLRNKTWTAAMTMSNILARFQRTGIYPLNCHALQNVHEKDSMARMSGLAFIPLCSPTCHSSIKETTVKYLFYCCRNEGV